MSEEELEYWLMIRAEQDTPIETTYNSIPTYNA